MLAALSHLSVNWGQELNLLLPILHQIVKLISNFDTYCFKKYILCYFDNNGYISMIINSRNAANPPGNGNSGNLSAASTDVADCGAGPAPGNEPAKGWWVGGKYDKFRAANNCAVCWSKDEGKGNEGNGRIGGEDGTPSLFLGSSSSSFLVYELSSLLDESNFDPFFVELLLDDSKDP